MLFKLSWRYLRHHLVTVIIICALQLLQTIAALSLPTLNADIIDNGVVTGDTSYIWRTGWVMLLVTLGQGICTALAVYLGAKTAMGLGQWLRLTIFDRVQGFTSRELHHFGPPSLITRATNDVQQIQMVVLMTFTIIVMAPIMGIGGIIMAIHQDGALSMLLLAVVPILALVVGVIMHQLRPLFRLQQERIDAVNDVLRAQLSGVRVIRAFIRQDSERNRFAGANDQVREVALGIGNLFALLFPAVNFIIGLSSVAVMWFGGGRINSGNMQVGALVAFLSYLMQILFAVMIASMMFIMVPRAEICADRIEEVLAVTSTISSPKQPHPLPAGELTFALDNVALQYPGAQAPVIEDVCLTLQPGTTTAIIGSTGTGKTTLVNLFPRLIEATAGQVTINGHPITDFDVDQVRQRIALVPQKAYLFSGTIASSISGVAPELCENNTEAATSTAATSDTTTTPTTTLPTGLYPHEIRERVTTALAGAQASEFVNNFDDGIDHEVLPAGVNFSGGQRQRLTIARALYRQADLLIFDDSFSALDYATDAKLRAELRSYAKNAAILIVAQRVSTIRHATQIYVLDQGRIAGAGTHEELLDSCQPYREIVASQISEEEAA